MADLLNMDYINGLPQLWVDGWPVCDIDVETGLFRIDVCGLFEARHIGSVISFTDADGVDHDPETFYLEQS